MKPPRVPMNFDSIMAPEPEHSAAIPDVQPLAPSLQLGDARLAIVPTVTIAVRVPVEVRDGIATLKARTGMSSQDLVGFALKRLLADNGIG